MTTTRFPASDIAGLVILPFLCSSGVTPAVQYAVPVVEDWTRIHNPVIVWIG